MADMDDLLMGLAGEDGGVAAVGELPLLSDAEDDAVPTLDSPVAHAIETTSSVGTGASAAGGAAAGAGAGDSSRGEARARRARAAVTHFSNGTVGALKPSARMAAASGAGTTLGDMEGVKARINKEKPKTSEPLQQAYLLLIGRRGGVRNLKPHLRAFSGLADTSPEKLERLRERTSKISVSLLKSIMDMLCIDRSSTSFIDGKTSKENLVARFVEWAAHPTAGAATSKATKAPAKKRKAKSTPKAGSGDGAAKRKRVGDEPGVSAEEEAVRETTLKLLQVADLTKLSSKELRKKVGSELNIDDMTPHKATVKEVITEFLAAQ